MNAIAIDFGGTTIKIGIFMDDQVKAFSKLEADSKNGLVNRLKDVEEEISRLIAGLGLTYRDFSGMGIAMPGIVHFHDKRVISINEKYKDAVAMDFEKWVHERFHLPVILDNDANCALLGEYALGTTEGSRYAALMIFGTGVGTAAMMDGKLLRGAHYQAGCLGGHMIMDYDGYPCNCGNIGCLEAQASTWAAPIIVKGELGFANSSLAKEKEYKIGTIVDHARRGDDVANKILQDLIHKWSAGIINLIHAYDPEVIVLSGGVMNAADLIAEKLFKRVRDLAWTPYGDINLKVSSNPEQSVLHGLNHLVKENLHHV